MSSRCIWSQPSRKNQDFLFLPLPPVLVWLKMGHLRKGGNNKKWISISCKMKKKKIENFWFFFWKTWNGGEFTKLVPGTESGNREDHELRGSPVVLFSTGRNLKFSWISRKRRHETLCFFSNLIRNKTFWWWAILPWTIFLEIKLCKHNAIFGHGISHRKSVEKNKKILSLWHLHTFLSLWQCNGKTDLVRKLIVFLLIINNK